MMEFLTVDEMKNCATEDGIANTLAPLKEADRKNKEAIKNIRDDDVRSQTTKLQKKMFAALELNDDSATETAFADLKELSGA